MSRGSCCRLKARARCCAWRTRGDGRACRWRAARGAWVWRWSWSRPAQAGPLSCNAPTPTGRRASSRRAGWGTRRWCRRCWRCQWTGTRCCGARSPTGARRYTPRQCRTGTLPVVEVLVAAGWPPLLAQKITGWVTCLHVATSQCNLPVVEALCRYVPPAVLLERDDEGRV
jgi:hypothetical protein